MRSFRRRRFSGVHPSIPSALQAASLMDPKAPQIQHLPVWTLIPSQGSGLSYNNCPMEWHQCPLIHQARNGDGILDSSNSFNHFSLKKKKINLLIYLAVSALGCSVRDFHCFAWALQLWLKGLVAPAACGISSPTRDWTLIPCSARWILNPWTTREVPPSSTSKSPLPMWSP